MTNVVKVIVREPVTVEVDTRVLPGPPGPPGAGDMSKLTYDPRGFEADVYDISNMTGVLDAGTF